MKTKILKWFLTIFVIIGVCFGAYFTLKAFGLNDIDKLREIVNNGIWGVIIYIILQIIQVIFIPINTTLFTVPAIVLFGSVKAFFISWIGCALGSILMFLIARYLGNKVLKWLVGEEKANRYASLLGKGKFLLPLFLLIPIFPDDIMCASAGLGKINFMYFVVVVVVTRAIDTACTCFIGASLIQSIPGIIVLCVFVILMLIASIWLTKNREKVENWFVNKFNKNNKD